MAFPAEPSPPSVVVTAELWRQGVGGSLGWATAAALLFILAWHYTRRFFFVFLFRRLGNSSPSSRLSPPSDLQFRAREVVSDDDLKFLIDNLEESPDASEKWEAVTERRNITVYYNAKCCRPKNGPLKYLSVTLFENCSPELLRDFYMDNEYRKLWDKTVTAFEQLEMDKSNGTEIGRIIKKFPLLTAREYVLAWKLWQGSDGSFYCFTKECEHPSVPRQKKFVRVGYFRSGWRIRKVPGQNASEIRMFHQEDAGLNVDMAKLAFSKGIWSYVCKMDSALRKYHPTNHSQQVPAVNALLFIQKIPQELDTKNGGTGLQNSATPSLGLVGQSTEEIRKSKRLLMKPSKKVLANGAILLGGVLFLTRGNPAVGAKVAMAYVLTKLSKRGGTSSSPGQRLLRS